MKNYSLIKNDDISRFRCKPADTKYPDYLLLINATIAMRSLSIQPSNDPRQYTQSATGSNQLYPIPRVTQLQMGSYISAQISDAHGFQFSFKLEIELFLLMVIS